jgi:hypothetical protein
MSEANLPPNTPEDDARIIVGLSIDKQRVIVKFIPPLPVDKLSAIESELFPRIQEQLDGDENIAGLSHDAYLFGKRVNEIGSNAVAYYVEQGQKVGYSVANKNRRIAWLGSSTRQSL